MDLVEFEHIVAGLFGAAPTLGGGWLWIRTKVADGERDRDRLRDELASAKADCDRRLERLEEHMEAETSTLHSRINDFRHEITEFREAVSGQLGRIEGKLDGMASHNGSGR